MKVSDTKSKSKTATETSFAAPANADLPDFDTRSPADSEMERFVPPAESQWRRPLREHELMAWVAMKARPVNATSEQVGMEIFAQIAAATTVEAVLTGKVETTKGKDILDVAMACDAIKFIPSTEVDGAPFFTVLSVRNSNSGESDVVSLGGWMVLAQCAMMDYLSTELPEDSPYLVPQGTPGALAKDTYPHYFRIKQKDTPSGHMNYLVAISAT